MPWELLAVLLVFVFSLAVRLARRRRGRFAGSGRSPILTPRVEVVGPCERRKKAALDAASAALR